MNMPRILALAGRIIRQVVRDRRTLALIFVVPLLVMTPAAVAVDTPGAVGAISEKLPEPPVRENVVPTAAALASGLFLLLQWFGAGTTFAAASGAVAGFILRGAAIRWSLALPAYRGPKG